ncbi:MAG: adenosylcobinamide-GDP ribazoletransferase [Lachnospiraceae bacterium]|nr:adenosylcobinamide-GDP ribazoletransferase [Lachnospiraceae bacterium]
MSVLKTICLAFSMYSRVPMPQLMYTEKDMRYVFLGFPLIGVVIGILEMGWYILCEKLGIGNLFYASAASAIPFFVTGGFHMDGFLDTTDALSSYGSQEKKLTILKDSHVGAFAVIWTGVYLVLNVGAYSEIHSSLAGSGNKMNIMTCVSFIYILSRITSGLAAVTFPSATGKGAEKSSLAGFKKMSAKNIVRAGLLIYLLAAFGILTALHQVIGMTMLIALAAVFLYYYKMSQKQFGGITGDLAGWYLQVCEQVLLYIVVLGGYALGIGA